MVVECGERYAARSSLPSRFPQRPKTAFVTGARSAGFGRARGCTRPLLPCRLLAAGQARVREPGALCASRLKSLRGYAGRGRNNGHWTSVLDRSRVARECLSIGPCEANGVNVEWFWACNRQASGVNSISTTAQSLSGAPGVRISFPPKSAPPCLSRCLRAEPAPNPPDGTAHNGVLVSRIQQFRRCADMLDVKRRLP